MTKIVGIFLGLLVLTASEEQQAATQPNSFLDIIPFVSQGKSLIQLAFGDVEGAKRTQELYLQDGLGPAQLRSGYYLVTGEPDKALDVQKQFLVNAEAVVDSLPVVGHAKGLVHILAGDEEHGWRAVKAATSTTGSVVGGLFGGPVGAVAGHVLTDFAISGVDQAMNGNASRDHGIVEYVANLRELDVGQHVDAISGLLLDVAGGRSASKLQAKSLPKNKMANNAPAVLLSERETVRQPPLTSVVETDRVQTAPAWPQNRGSGAPNRRTVAEQQMRRLQPDFIAFADVAETQNNIKFFEFSEFLLENPVYKGYHLHSQLVPEFTVPINLKKIAGLGRTEIMKISTDKLTYLSDVQKSLLAKEDLFTVNTLYNEKQNCVGCSVAGVLKIDVETLQTQLVKLSNKAYTAKQGAHPDTFMAECEMARIINYERSPELVGLQNLYEYLKGRPIDDVYFDKSTIVSMYDGNHEGHTCVMKYKFHADSPVPAMVLIDYQQLPYLDVFKPNPLRIVNYVDTTTYKTFCVYTVWKYDSRLRTFAHQHRFDVAGAKKASENITPSNG